MSLTGRRASFPLLLAALLVATIARLAVLGTLGDQGSFAKYPSMAQQYLEGASILERLGDLSPAYFWAVVAGTAAGFDVTALVRLQVIATSVAALLCAVAARRLGGEVAMWIAAAALLATPGAFLNALELEPETLILLLTSIALVAALRGGAGYAAVAGVALGLSTATRPSAILTLLIAAATMTLARRSPRQAVTLLAAAVACIALVAGNNARLTGSFALMDPGSVFYEGMNPDATGLAGVQPQIVNDLEATTNEVDALHIMYRRVAAASTGAAETNRDAANAFWKEKAFQYVRHYPAEAAALTLRKLVAAGSRYDPWDLLTIVRKERELRSALWLPFPLLLVLSVGGAVALRRRDPSATLLLVGFAATPLVTMLLFYVTARQRNPMLPALAILTGVCSAAALQRIRRDGVRPRLLLTALAGALVVGVLTLPSTLAREDNWGWATLEMRLQAAATSPWPESSAAAFAVRPDLMTELPYPAVASAAMARLQGPPPQRFDSAVALIAANEPARAIAVLRELRERGYAPHRENRLPRSLSYHQARALLRLGRRAEAQALLPAAEDEAPGNQHVLALRSLLDDPSAAERLRRIHDPLTAGYALAVAAADIGDIDRAARGAMELRRVVPEWRRPRALLAALRQQVLQRR